MAVSKVGGDVDAYCTKCRMILGHTVLAMVGERIARARCNTCMGEHAYKSGPPGTVAKTGAVRAAGGGKKAPLPRVSRAKVDARPFEEIFEGKDPATARTYSPKERYAKGEAISHPSFGLGLVESARDDKIDVVFKTGQKTLIHGLATGKGPITFTKAKRPSFDTGSTEELSTSSGAADKPPPGAAGLHVVHTAPPTELPQRPAEPAAAPGEELA